jgi:hypothetical protein
MPFKSDTATVHTIGIDTGKNTLHMIGLDEKRTIVLREKVARGRIAARLVNVPQCLRHRSRHGNALCCPAYRSDLWRHATSVAAGPGWARAMAGATREGNSSRQPNGDVPLKEVARESAACQRLFLARLPSHAGSGAAQLAN